MKGRNSVFFQDATQHIYQRANDLGVIFYGVEDRIVYYTLAAVNAKKHNVFVPAASIMYTHIHQSVQSPSLKRLRSYLHDTDTSFVRLYNHRYSRKGQLIERYAGRSQKISLKAKRSNIIYIYNNHVEKKLCEKAIQERWSFLAYAATDHPFSNELKIKEASRLLKKSINLVNRRIKSMKGLEYSDLEKILPNLDPVEYEQFIDYVISHYAWIDFNAAISYFGDFGTMVIAIDSTTGGEYDINEDYSTLPDTAYLELAALAKKEGYQNSVFNLSPTDMSEFVFRALKETSATKYHLTKFLHHDF